MKDLYVSILNTRVNSNHQKDLNLDIEFIDDQKNLMNSLNETLENILKTLVSQASSPKEDCFKVSEGLDICDFKQINLKSNITKDTLKSFSNNFDKEKEFDTFKKYLENLLGFFEENSHSFSKQRYNNLLLFMLISQTKQAFSYKLLESKC